MTSVVEATIKEDITKDITMKEETAKREREEETKETTTTTEIVAPSEEPSPKKVKIELTDGMKGIIKKQMEYYLCDDNLKFDKFFQEIIRQSEDGWIAMENFMNCRKIAALKITEEDIYKSLDGSTEVEIDEKKGCRRTGNRELPPLQKRENFKKNKDGQQDIIAIMTSHSETSPLLYFQVNMKGVEDALGFAISLKTGLKDKIQKDFGKAESGKAQTPEVCWSFKQGQFDESPEHQIIILKRRGFTDVDRLNNLEFDVKHKEANYTLTLEKIENLDLKKKLWEACPSFLKKEHSKNIAKNKAKIILPGWEKKQFDSINVLRNSIKEVLNAHSFGEIIPEDSSDYKFLMCLLKFHPNPQKLNGMKSLVVNPYDGDEKSRCLFIIKEDGTQDNISTVKCLAEVQSRQAEFAQGKIEGVKQEIVKTEVKPEIVETEVKPEIVKPEPTPVIEDKKTEVPVAVAQ